MSDLYRIKDYDPDEEGVDYCLVRLLQVGALVKVEPVLIVTDDWTPVDSLPEGRYAVVRLEGNDE